MDQDRQSSNKDDRMPEAMPANPYSSPKTQPQFKTKPVSGLARFGIVLITVLSSVIAFFSTCSPYGGGLTWWSLFANALNAELTILVSLVVAAVVGFVVARWHLQDARRGRGDANRIPNASIGNSGEIPVEMVPGREISRMLTLTLGASFVAFFAAAIPAGLMFEESWDHLSGIPAMFVGFIAAVVAGYIVARMRWRRLRSGL